MKSFDSESAKYYHARLMSGVMVIDSRRFAQRRESLAGSVPIRSLGRLKDQLYSDTGDLHYEISGLLDANGRPAIRGIIRGEIELICQRCLGPLRFPIKLEPQFLLVGREADLPDLSEEAEDIDAIVAAPDLDVLSLIEDEVILALPIAPRHDFDCHPDFTSTQGNTRPESAFVDLKALKKH